MSNCPDALREDVLFVGHCGAVTVGLSCSLPAVTTTVWKKGAVYNIWRGLFFKFVFGVLFFPHPRLDAETPLVV